MATNYQGDAQEQRALDALIKLQRAAGSVAERLLPSIASAGLTVSQFGILEALLHLGPLTQTDLCRKLLKTGGNITLVVDNLERDGLVRRERRTQDRRTVLVHLTEPGRQLIEKAFPAHVGAVMAEMSVLSPAEQQELARLCRKLGRQEREPATRRAKPAIVPEEEPATNVLEGWKGFRHND